jgi:hypothetical protein
MSLSALFFGGYRRLHLGFVTAECYFMAYSTDLPFKFVISEIERDVVRKILADPIELHSVKENGNLSRDDVK